MRRTIAAGVLAGSVLMTSADGPRSPEAVGLTYTAAEATFTSADKRLIETTFRDGVSYWASQGIGNMATTRLVMLEGSQTFTCIEPDGEPHTLKATSFSEEYCAKKRAIVVPAFVAYAHHQIGPGDISVVFGISHELGHAASDEGDFNQQFVTDPVPLELEATRLAGQLMATHFSPEQLESYAAYLRRLDIDDGQHGTWDQQADALLQGAQES